MMNNFNRSFLVVLIAACCTYSASAQQQAISEKVAAQSIAAQAMLDSAEKAGMVSVQRLDTEQEKIDSRAASQQPTFARIPAVANSDSNSDTRRSSKMNRAFTSIKKMLDQGDQYTARNSLVEFVHRWPENTQARLLLAKLEILQGNFQQAQLVLQPLTLGANSGWQAWFWSGTAKLQEGLFDLAREDLKQASARDARVPDIWIQQAVVEQKAGNYIGAIQLLHVARKLAPAKPQIHLNLAYSNEQLGEFSSALKNYQMFLLTSVNLKPNQYQARVVRRISELSAELL